MKHSTLTLSVFRLISLACLGLACAPIHAEKADSTKETIIEAGYGESDGKTSVRRLSKGVSLVRGTLNVKAENAVVTEAPNGDQFVVLTAGSNRKVTFRQKRDGGPDLWVDGEADRAEYNQSTEIVKFISKAKVRYLEGKRVTQEQEGEYLSYDSKNDVFIGTNSTTGQHVEGSGTLKIILQPKPEKQAN
ncbi:lipopolysaccharide transport periplasmic protein LptA [Undibacterium sp. TS12]|uniref:lipopolysaccharide transport periplasmic protein LptA n=1 Tax=Undibacterium sp. TS12 TaxID=2908202 RepID=UPI001F4CCAC6|nr:lipopolysaccharide transport periplasmic protein LptA [Undibacterium sp. TS12]MCH8617628.1 lipopolysaccharide transport periplasmic protein LptA [Undibacterium sp. TS12]